MWNDLPEEIRIFETLASFKTKIKFHRPSVIRTLIGIMSYQYLFLFLSILYRQYKNLTQILQLSFRIFNVKVYNICSLYFRLYNFIFCMYSLFIVIYFCTPKSKTSLCYLGQRQAKVDLFSQLISWEKRCSIFQQTSFIMAAF